MAISETYYATTADGHRLAYQTLGEHPVDVLSMGAYFSNLEHMWTEPTIARMNRRLSTLGRLILLNGRGTGLSDPIPEGPLPTLEERIDDMKAVLDAVTAERVALVSFADSGPLCCLFAATYPDRTLALVLCNTSPRMAWAPDHPWGIDPDEYEHQLADTATRWGTREYAAEIVRNGSPSRAEDTALIDWWEESMRQSASPEAAATLLRMYYEMDVRDVLPAIHVPTLVLSRGGELAEESAATAGRIPGAIHSVMPGHDRMVMGGHADSYCDAIQEFVRRVRDEEADLDRVLATVLFTDIVGSTQHAAALGDRAWKELVERHHSFVRGTLPRWRGREQDTAGDGFFAAFDGPARAIRCALAIVEGIRSIGLEVRAGIHTGECEMIDTKVGGLTVAIGARVASEAGPSEVLVSQTVKDLVAGCGLEFEGRGEHELKGVPDRWRLYRVVSERA